MESSHRSNTDRRAMIERLRRDRTADQDAANRSWLLAGCPGLPTAPPYLMERRQLRPSNSGTLISMKTAALLATRDANRSGKSQAAENALKHFCLDTNVLIGDPKSIFQFEDNHVFIPVEVIEELDAIRRDGFGPGEECSRGDSCAGGVFPDSVNMEEGVRLPNGGRSQW